MTVTTDDVSIFFHYCVYVRSVYMHGWTLFETADQADKDRLTNAAPVFFGDLNKILVEYVILQICKITDPAKDVRGSYNHTIEFFLTESDFATEPAKAQRLAQLHKRMQTIRSKVKPAWDKLISHLDRDVLRAGTVLGVAPEHEWERFWRDLDEFVAVLYQKYVSDPPHHILDVIPITDTLMLQEAIRRGTLFDQLASGPDKAISMKCLGYAGLP